MAALTPTAALELPVRAEGGLLPPPVWLGGLGWFVLGDRNGVYAVLPGVRGLVWQLEARIGFGGFAIDGNDLFVQNGHVLAKFDMSSFGTDEAPPAPTSYPTSR